MWAGAGKTDYNGLSLSELLEMPPTKLQIPHLIPSETVWDILSSRIAEMETRRGPQNIPKRVVETHCSAVLMAIRDLTSSYVFLQEISSCTLKSLGEKQPPEFLEKSLVPLKGKGDVNRAQAICLASV